MISMSKHLNLYIIIMCMVFHRRRLLSYLMFISLIPNQHCMHFIVCSNTTSNQGLPKYQSYQLHHQKSREKKCTEFTAYRQNGRKPYKYYHIYRRKRTYVCEVSFWYPKRPGRAHRPPRPSLLNQQQVERAVTTIKERMRRPFIICRQGIRTMASVNTSILGLR